MSTSTSATTQEGRRLDAAKADGVAWRRWGTYLSERAWGTVREDYSADGDAWRYFPFEHAHSRVYRWNEDGLAGFCDEQQHLCLSIALWNEHDPILKERMYGLSNGQGNHGEDAKDYWFYLDNLPTHAYAKMVYKYPQAAFPYGDLLAVNGQRDQSQPEYELFDALKEEWLENRYFDVFIEYAKADVEDILCRVTVVNRGPDPAPIHVLPQLWYRNTWSWESDGVRYQIAKIGEGAAGTEHPALGRRWYYAATADGGTGELLFCENETNYERLFGVPNQAAFVKDGVNDYLVRQAEQAVNRMSGSKLAAHFERTLEPGEEWVIQVRFSPRPMPEPFSGFDELVALRRQEADEFYASIHAAQLDDDQRLVQRQALAGLLWSKQYYHYVVYRWLQGDPTQPPPPPERRQGRNAEWRHLINEDVILMPDPWEYPWYAAWDLMFHCVAVAMIDPEFAKRQLRLITSATYQHPYGQVPAYEWDFGDVNPPLIAWGAWQVYQLDLVWSSKPDVEFLRAMYRTTALLANWWFNRKDERGKGIFGGGFLGMDNIGVFNRDQPLPTGGTLQQADGTAWMATLMQHLLQMNVELARFDPTVEDMLLRYLFNFMLIARVLEDGIDGVELWDDEQQFYFDVVGLPDGTTIPLKVFTMDGLVPLFTSVAVKQKGAGSAEALRSHFRGFLERHPQLMENIQSHKEMGDGTHFLYAAVFGERLRNILKRVLDPEQFLSAYGIRAVSRYHRDHPYTFEAGGEQFTVAYWPNVSHDRMFGGNSNWRGPIWFPVNFVLIQSIYAYARFYGDTFTVELPTGSGNQATLAEVADELARRLTTIFLRDDEGRRAVLGDNEYIQTDPHWRDCIPFHEYFDGDNGAGVGASHQTGWTATVAVLLQYGGSLRFADHAARTTTSEVLETLNA